MQSHFLTPTVKLLVGTAAAVKINQVDLIFKQTLIGLNSLIDGRQHQ